jgi:formylglycine-generating enzyme required for sulfatase activity
MSDELKVGLFQKVMKGYVIGEDNEPQYAYRLKAILNDPSQASNVLTFANFFDAGEFTKRLSHLSGRRFEIPTYEEWEAAKKSVGSQLSGNLWEWTRSVLMYGLSRSMEHNYLHSLIKAHSIHRDPLSRSSKYAVRLIEYI